MALRETRPLEIIYGWIELHALFCLGVSPEDALENAAQSSDLSEPTLTRIYDAHRQLIELRAAQKLNAGQVESNGSVLVRAEDI